MTPSEAYDRMIHYVTVAEDYVAKNGKEPAVAGESDRHAWRWRGDIAPMLRGAVAVAKGEGAVRPHGERLPHLPRDPRIRQFR